MVPEGVYVAATVAHVKEIDVLELRLSILVGARGAEGMSATANLDTALKSDVPI